MLRKPSRVSKATRGDNADRRIAQAIRTTIGKRLQEMYSQLVEEPIPSNITDLLRRLDE
jgi:hypothetical protein